MMSVVFLTIGSVLLVSAMSLVGIVFVFFRKEWLDGALYPLVSFAAGSLIGDVFIHILPELSEANTEFFPIASLLIAVGILLSFALEKIILWRHHHCLGCAGHPKSAGLMILVGDAAHNVMDGILIAGSYLADTRLGIATTIAVMLHEIPQEIGDYAILLSSGYSKFRALFLNFLIAMTAIFGAVVVLILQASMPDVEQYILPLVAGNFLYISVADLLPELRKQTQIRYAVIQLIAAGLGVLLMACLAFME
jgi:zinc and cadmium transporter